jgi:hypothetical protein
MGLSCGVVLHGNIGSENRMEWGLIGDEVRQQIFQTHDPERDDHKIASDSLVPL